MKRRWLRSRSLLIMTGAILFLGVLPFISQHFIGAKFNRLTKTVTHIIKWDLNPGLTVSVSDTKGTQLLFLPGSNASTGLLKVNPLNPHYFTDGSGKNILLAGSHTWQNFQDSGTSYPPPAFNYTAYLDFLKVNNHNFFRLWAWEQPRWSIDSKSDNFWFSPMPYQRTGTELAADELPKFDLTQFNQTYFDRLRERVIEARRRGIYVSIMLFNGWSVVSNKGIPGGKSPWRSHPMNQTNNVNRVNGDLNGDGSGEEVHQLAIPNITAIQQAYVRKVIDTVNDLDNVLYEISNESDPSSIQWQYHMIDFIKTYEGQKPKQHLVGMTSTYPDGENSSLVASPADWISPNGDINNPSVGDERRVIVADTDHLCGVCGDRQWVWKSFTRGENPIFMDVYDGKFDLIVEQVPSKPLTYAPWVNLRRNLGYILTYANRINLVAMSPHPELCSSEYCLANPASNNGEYLVYLPSGGKVTVDLKKTTGNITGEWFNPEDGLVIAKVLTTGGVRRTFVSPFNGDSVLYLKST